MVKKKPVLLDLEEEHYMENFFTEKLEKEVKKALAQAEIMLEAKDAPAGEQTVILGPGWPGILLHEAIGHGLEGDFNRKKLVFYRINGVESCC